MTKPSRAKATREDASGGEDVATRQLLLRVPKDLHAALRHLAIDEDKSINAILTKVIADWYAKRNG